VDITLEIDRLAHGGDGIGRVDGQVCFVPGGLPGDTVRAEVVRKTKSALWARITEIVVPSPNRVEHCCGPAQSGACFWGHFAYPAQAEWKQHLVTEALQRFAGVEVPLGWREDPALRLGYRTRAEFHSDGERFGFYAHGSHDIVDLTECRLCHPRVNAAIPALREASIKGSVTVTVNPEGDETLVWTKFPKRKLKSQFPLANTPNEEGPRFAFVFDGIPVVNGCFSQASLLLNRLLVAETHRLIGDTASVYDCYCGSGNLSLTLPKAVKVGGMDHSRPAVRAAKEEKRGDYRHGDENGMIEAIGSGKWETIVLDPPRTGAKRLAPALAASPAKAIVYVSCDPVTLARDLKTLAEGGWAVQEAVALDLFPQTPHVETVVRLERPA